MIELFLNLMVLQTLMGAFDTLYHHEFRVGLPRCPSAAKELSIHAIRALLYGILFFGLAWFEWHGAWIFLLIALVLCEVGLTLWDFVVEDHSRLLPPSERITHTLLAINGGAAFVLLALELPDWWALPSTLHQVEYGWQSWFLTVGAIGVAVSGLRDGLAAWSVQRLDLRLGLTLGGYHRLLLSGGTGFIGSAFCRELLYQGHQITLLTRNPVAAAIQFGGRVRTIRNTDQLSDQEVFDVVVNLAGAPVVGWPWTVRRRATLLASRLDTTRALLEYVQRAQKRPKVWIQASAIGFYGTNRALTVDETAPAGTGFAATLCQQWEAMTKELESYPVRCVTLRFGLVFGRSGGALPMMMLPYRMGGGAVLGQGNQYVGWIHIEDVLRLLAKAITSDSMQGILNAVAPDCPSHSSFARQVGQQLLRPVWLRIPEGWLRGLLGEMACLFVDGPRVVPQRLLQEDFEFRFPTLRSALMDLN